MLDYFASLDVFGWLEIAAMIVGFIYVYYETIKSRKMWYWWIFSAVLNVFVYWHSHYLSMMLIQFYYIVSAVYGIRQWSKVLGDSLDQHGPDRRPDVMKIGVKRFDRRKGLISSLIAVAVFIVLAPLFNRFALESGNVIFDGQPYFDTALAVLSMLATYWLSQSFKEQWYIWLVVNVASIPVFVAGGIYWMALLYAGYLAMCFVGLYQWNKYGVLVE